jgi:NADH dehydrogenase
MKESQAHVVILGGGFAGLSAARQFEGQPVRVTLVDRQNHHLFQPLLYQVATAGLAAPDIAQPLRHIFSKQQNVTTLMDEVVSIDPLIKKVILKRSSLDYDYLIIALGASTSYFGNNDWAQYAQGLKTLDEATQLRRRLLLCFEEAEMNQGISDSDQNLSFIVIGGGPTGVETAGALAELARRVLADDFRRIDPSSAHIHLVEAGPRLLPMFSEKQSEYTRLRLEKMGVTVHLNSLVSELGPKHVIAGDSRIEASIILWAAGMEGNPVAHTFPEVPLDRSGRIQVESDLSLPKNSRIFVAGDLVSLIDPKGVRVPGVAPAASQMGRHAARQILAYLKGRQTKPFVYIDKGNMATIGRSSAVASIAGWHSCGWIAWTMWLSIHLLFLIGLRNRLSVFMHWVWSYVTWQRGARIITGTNVLVEPSSSQIEDKE